MALFVVHEGQWKNGECNTTTWSTKMRSGLERNAEIRVSREAGARAPQGAGAHREGPAGPQETGLKNDRPVKADASQGP